MKSTIYCPDGSVNSKRDLPFRAFVKSGFPTVGHLSSIFRPGAGLLILLIFIFSAIFKKESFFVNLKSKVCETFQIVYCGTLLTYF